MAGKNMHNNDYAMFPGLDVGKGEHHAVSAGV
jgi:hypothetical protein